MKPLSKEQREEVFEEVYLFGYFMERLLDKKTDADGKKIDDETILKIIEAENNMEMFSDYQSEYNPCEACGSHGTVKVKINNKTITIREW